MDKVFKALADPTRREILDLLKETDGQSLGEIEGKFPKLSRFAVMKHLKTLEEAMLITTRKAGRFKYHYLNAVPIQEISDRWISRFAGHWAKSMLDFKRELETEAADEKESVDKNMSNKPKHLYNMIIQTTVDALWDALINPEITQQYFFDLRVDSKWEVGAPIEYIGSEEKAFIQGEILEFTPKSKIVYSFKGGWEEDPASRVSFEIEALGTNACKLIVVHDEFETETTTFTNVGNGWPTILSGLKTLLETGKPLTIPN